MAEVQVASDMTARVWKIEVAVGDRVKAGDTLLVLEAMKMEIAVEAPSAGTVKQVLVAAETSVEEGQILVLLEV